MDKRAVRDFIVKLSCILVAAFVLTVLGSYVFTHSLELNKGSFFDGLVAFTSGASIAVFLALIQSNEERIKKLQDYPRASWNIYITVFLNTFIIACMWGFADNTVPLLGVQTGDFISVVAILLAAQILLRIKDLLALYLKN